MIGINIRKRWASVSLSTLAVCVFALPCGAWPQTSEQWANWDQDGYHSVAYSMVLGSDGNIYAAGMYKQTSTGENWDWRIVSLTTDGGFNWKVSYDRNSYDDRAYAISHWSEGKVYAAGYTKQGGAQQDYMDFMVVSRHTSNGGADWAYPHTGAAFGRDCALDVTSDPSGNVYAAGYLFNGFDLARGVGPSLDMAVLSLTSNGGSNWRYDYDGPVDGSLDSATAIVYANGTIYVAGSSYNPANGNNDITVIALDQNGKPLWTPAVRTRHIAGNDAGACLAVDPSGNIYVGGRTGSLDMVVVSWTAGGVYRWQCVHNGGGSTGDWVSSIACDGNHVYAAGTCDKSSAEYDMTVLKLNASDGGLAWNPPYYYDGNEHRADFANSIALGVDGNIYVAGVSNFPLSWTQGEFTLISLAPDKTERWVYTHAGMGDRYDEAFDLAYDPAGYVYAAGVRTNDVPNWDLTVVSVLAQPGLCYGTTEPSSGRHLVRQLGTANMHVAFHTNSDNVRYRSSPDGGVTWSPIEHIDQGEYPSIGVINIPIPEPTEPMVAYLHSSGELRYRWKDIWAQPPTWQGFTIYPPPLGFGVCSGPPSIYTTGSIVHVVYPVDEGGGNHGIYYNSFNYDASGPGSLEMVETGSTYSLTNPSIVCDGNWTPHVIYEKDNRLEYAYKDPMFWAWNHSKQIPWYPSTVGSRKPFIECFGDVLYAPWSELLPAPDKSDIYHATRQLPDGGWNNEGWITTTPALASETPTAFFWDGSTHTYTYAEMNPGTSGFDIQYRLMSNAPAWVLETTPRSYWPHSNVGYDPLLEKRILYSLWTEGDAPNTYVKFDTVELSSFDKGERGGYYAVNCGVPEQSRFCHHRTGYKKVGDYNIDYGNDSLVYNLDFLDPCYEYAAKLFFVHDGATSRDLKPVIDGQQLPTIRVRPLSLDTLWVTIPRSLYGRDHAIRLSLKNLGEGYAFCQKVKLYRYEPKRKVLSGGGQGAVASAIRGLNLTISPSLTRQRLTIRYGLNASGTATISLYDASGRLVQVIRSGRQTAGDHVIAADVGRLPSGVYFVRLDAEGRHETNKIILSK